MKDFNFGDFVWYKGEGWRYVGMDEDGCFWMCRPQPSVCFDIVEFERVYASEDEDIDTFMKENGETVTEMCRRKGIEIPKKGNDLCDTSLKK